MIQGWNEMARKETASRPSAVLVVGFILMLTLKENPLAKSVNHTGHPGGDAL